jgi:hypothetical protein
VGRARAHSTGGVDDPDGVAPQVGVAGQHPDELGQQPAPRRAALVVRRWLRFVERALPGAFTYLPGQSG